MKIKRYEYDTDSDLAAADPEHESQRPTCLANVGLSDHPRDYVPCGLTMRRRRNGVTVCPEHGEMY